MEHMDSGSLTSLITKFQIPEPLIAYVCKEVCQGLQYTPSPTSPPPPLPSSFLHSFFRVLFRL